MNFNTNRAATRLVRAAERTGIAALEGKPATPVALAELAWNIKRAIFAQVLCGQWKEFDVHDVDDFEDLKVTARLGRPMIDEQQVVIEYDFTHTRLGTLVVGRKAV